MQHSQCKLTVRCDVKKRMKTTPAYVLSNFNSKS